LMMWLRAWLRTHSLWKDKEVLGQLGLAWLGMRERHTGS
jgi:hypothetical protein